MSKVFAIQFARREKSYRKEHFYRGDCCGDDAMPIVYFIWFVEAADGTRIVFDTGFTPETAARRGDRKYFASPVETLEQLGYPADSMDYVVISHLHYDHTGFVSAFPGATVLVQRSELEFWTGPLAGRGDYPHLVESADIDWIEQNAREGRVELIHGDRELAEGVSLVHTGGHTPGLQLLAVRNGPDTAVLTSDASHFYENIMNDRPYAIVDHLPSMYLAFDTVRGLASSDDLIVPGHDPQVTERFHEVPGVPLAVRIGE